MFQQSNLLEKNFKKERIREYARTRYDFCDKKR